MSNLTYYNFAMKSFDNLDRQFNLAVEMDWFNLFAPECEQILEKLMKAILELMTTVSVPDRLYKSHKLHSIGEFINAYYPDTVNITLVSWIETFYFDARYPGDDSVIVSKAIAEKLKECTKAEGTKYISLHDSLCAPNATNFFGGTCQ